MKLSRVITILGYTLFACTVAYSAQRTVNLYKTSKINPTTVLVSCVDGKKPVVKQFENTPILMLTCSTNNPYKLDKELDKEFPTQPQ